MDCSDDSSHYFTEFTLSEIVDMENLFKELGDNSLHKDFCETVASTFSCSANRNGKSSVTWNQVHDWFQEKLKQKTRGKSKILPSPPLQIIDLSNTSNAGNGGNAAGNTTVVQKRKGKPSDVADLAFEAKSARDYAWYDVASFITYRVVRTGEMEVRVRFSGFDHQHDEWVNVKRSVRERSIPVEPSECGKVNVGDLVLCFQEREDQAVYCDAHVLDIIREIHDQGKCNCVFLVCFDHDNTEVSVGHNRICRRPDE